MECEAINVIDRFDWDYERVAVTSQWNGKLVQPLAADLSMNSIFNDTKVARATLDSNGTARVYLVEDTHGNDSYNPESGHASGDRDYRSSGSYDNSSRDDSSSRNVGDLARDVAEAYIAAREQNWVEAGAKSLDVAQDVIDVSQDVGQAFVESRTDAVVGGYAGNSDLGFQ